MDRYLIISADCHAGLPNPQYRDYLDPQYRERFDEYLDDRERARQRVQRGMLNEEFAEAWERENEEGLRGGWDAARRDKELDADGVAGEVIFPDADSVTGGASAPFGAGLGQSGEHDPELLMAGARAHNRWLAELCADSPKRRAGVAIVPILHDIDDAVVEIRRAHESGLRGGILIPSTWRPYPPYNDERYEPIWATCAELDMPIHVHSGAADAHDQYQGKVGIYVAEVRWWSTRPLWHLLWAGVFERNPELKFAVTECGCFWVPDLLWKNDIAYEREHGSQKLGEQLTAGLPMRPSEYFDRNCFIGASNIRRRELARRYEMGIDNLMWGNDFPHPEGTWPHTDKWLREAFHDIPVDETRGMLGLNAAQVYNFDLDAMNELAASIGPTPEDLGQTEDVTEKWRELKEAGRPWRTGKEAVPVPA